jgi:ABC-type multidrug transport system fused ATPase/permease subunit
VPTFLRLLSYLRPYRLWVILGFVFLVTAVALELAPPLVWKYMVDVVIRHRRWGALWPTLLLLIAIQGVSSLLSAFRSRLLETVGQNFVFTLRNQLFEKLTYQSLAYFNEARTGDLISRVSADVDAVQDVLVQGTDSVLANALRVMGVAVIFCLLNLKLGLATLLPMALVGLLLGRFNSQIKGVYKAARAQLGVLTAKLQDDLGGIRVIKSFAREGDEVAEFQTLSHVYLDQNLAAVRLRATFFPFVRWIASFGNTISIGYGAVLILQHQFSLGGLVAYRGYGRYFYGPIDSLTQINDTVQRAVAAGNRIFQVLDAPETVTDAPKASTLPRLEGEVRFDNVRFAYRAGGAPVFEALSLHVHPGQTAALVGASGAGKSTIFALLSRFWDPDTGAVLLDGQDLREVTQHSLRRQIASVQQDTFLFGSSVAENIRYGRPDASESEIESAARAANAHEFICRLPDGYATLVGERGVKLSGGQRQRLSVARAFLADPRLLLLDEATSSVEPESERVIQEAIERLMAGRTTIVAAHRLSTVKNADVIFVLEQGRLVEQGTHAELLASGGVYARMIRQQYGTSIFS